MVDDHDRRQREGHEHLREAREFAEWSRKDREERLPQLTSEQEAQLTRYLQLVERHGWSKSLDVHSSGRLEEDNCEGCPAVGLAKRAKQVVKGQSATE